MQRTGNTSYRARNVAARATRDAKRHTPVAELLPRWTAEIEATGWSVEGIVASVDGEAATRHLVAPTLRAEELRAIANEVLGPEGPLTARKVFCRRDVMLTVAPQLYGRDPGELQRAVDRTLADPRRSRCCGRWAPPGAPTPRRGPSPASRPSPPWWSHRSTGRALSR